MKLALIRKIILVFVAALIGCFWNGIVVAVPIQVNDNIPDNSFIPTGRSLTGSFDISSLLPSQGLQSATATFYFSDDYDNVYGGTSTGGYSCASAYYCYRYSYNYYPDEYESGFVNMEGQNASGTTSYYSNMFYNGANYFTQQIIVGSYSCGPGGNYWCPIYSIRYNYTYYYSQYYGYTGSFSVSFLLDSTRLASLNNDGIVNFTTAASSGDLYLRSASLEAIPNELVAASAPEPATLLLLGSGLASLGFLRRRKRAV